MKIERAINADGHAFRCTVTDHDAGWKVQQKRDAVVTLDVIRRDWRHVECDLMVFEFERRHRDNRPPR